MPDDTNAATPSRTPDRRSVHSPVSWAKAVPEREHTPPRVVPPAPPVPDTPPTLALDLAAATGVEIGAWILLALAAGALALALRAAAGRPGGLRSLFTAEPADLGDASRTADELRDLIAEARRLSDELADRFDGRAADMARLLHEADRRVTRLEQALRAEGLASSPPTMGPGDRSAVVPPGSATSPIFSDAPQRAPARAASMVEPVIHPAADPMAREIYRLSDEGLPPVEIASRLGQHTGKVELILALRRA